MKVLTVAFSRLFTRHPNLKRRKEGSPEGEAATYLGLTVSVNKDDHGAGVQLGAVTFIPSPEAVHEDGEFGEPPQPRALPCQAGPGASAA